MSMCMSASVHIKVVFVCVCMCVCVCTCISRYQKASRLLNEIERSLRVFNKPEILISYCEVLKKQENPAIRRIADDMLKELGKFVYQCFVAMEIY